jgi:hypothetical protein
MSMITAISELKVRRDIMLNNADVAGQEAQDRVNEANRLRKAAAELAEAILILEDYSG